LEILQTILTALKSEIQKLSLQSHLRVQHKQL